MQTGTYHLAFLLPARESRQFWCGPLLLLSAYLITELLLREKDEFGAVHLKHFYARRILRIWPLYFLTLLIGLALCRIDMQQKFPASYTVAFLVLSGNWMVSLVGFTQSVLNPLWSVSFEEQFYLLWPMLVAKSRRVNVLLVTGGIMTLIAAASRIILWKYARPGDTAIFTNTLARLDPLALGVVSAVVMHGRHLLLRWWVRVGFLGTGITILLLAGHFYHMNWSFLLIGYPAMAVGVWFLFMTVFQISFAPAWLRYLGKISYGL